MGSFVQDHPIEPSDEEEVSCNKREYDEESLKYLPYLYYTNWPQVRQLGAIWRQSKHDIRERPSELHKNDEGY